MNWQAWFAKAIVASVGIYAALHNEPYICLALTVALFLTPSAVKETK